jgi:hypothetical protein
MEPDIFISHSSADAELAGALAEALRKSTNGQLRCSSDAQGGFAPGDNWLDMLRSEIAEATVHVALITSRSLESTYFLLEVGARWGGGGENFFPVLAPDVRAEQLPVPIQLRQACRLGGQDSEVTVLELIHAIQEVLGVEGAPPRSYHQAVTDLCQSARGYEYGKPRPPLFEHYADDPQVLSADTIVRGAEEFLSGRPPRRDGFWPDVVIGVNSGGMIAGGIFGERGRLPVGVVWTYHDQRKRALDLERTFLPSVDTNENVNVLIVDAKVKSGDSIALVVDHVKKIYGAGTEIRLLVTLVYGGWEDRPEIEPPTGHFWPVVFRLGGDASRPLPLYATYYTNRKKEDDDIRELTKEPRRARIGLGW